MRHARRCPATTILRIEDQQIKEWGRCEKPAKHNGAHQHAERRWSFTPGSYSGLAEDHPDYYAVVVTP